jgi:hypothetical protein
MNRVKIRDNRRHSPFAIRHSPFAIRRGNPMSKPNHTQPQSRNYADQLVEDEALKVAKSIQQPGQTKEQTRLIAQGIAKGIALYKKQQAAQARERDKARKRALRAKRVEATPPETFPAEEGTEFAATADAAAGATLAAGGVLFGVMALAHLARAILGWALVVGTFPVPVWASAVAAAVLGALAGWFCFQAARLK